MIELIDAVGENVSRNALICLTELGASLRKSLDPMLVNLLDRLLKKAGETESPATSEAQNALCNISLGCSEDKILRVILFLN